MSEDTIGTLLQLPLPLNEELKKVARNNKRSLVKQIEWILERYIEAQRDDAA